MINQLNYLTSEGLILYQTGSNETRPWWILQLAVWVRASNSWRMSLVKRCWKRTRNPQNTLVSSHFPSGFQSLPKFGNMFIQFNMANKNPHFPYDSDHARLHVHVTHQKRGPNAARQLVAVGDMKTSNWRERLNWLVPSVSMSLTNQTMGHNMA